MNLDSLISDANQFVGGGLRYWAESPDTGPQGWGARAVVTLLFPKRARGSAAF